MLVSVIVPAYGHALWIRRALESLRAQTLGAWECVVVDDGSPDDTAGAIRPCLEDPRFRYHRLNENAGLGAALNAGLALARGDFIAYLPADDVYHAGHLASLVDCIHSQAGAVLAFSGVRHHYNRHASGRIEGYPLQLVQALHRAAPARWTERGELVTDDLDRMFWSKLGAFGAAVGTGRVTCEWVDHPGQRHKAIREPLGGVNAYRARYGVKEPLRFHSSVGNCIDEVELYRRFRERPDTPPAPDGLKIVLVGELAYNPERVLALEELGHRLYGLWMEAPYGYNTVGPLPFGHVRDIPRADWRNEVARLQPDVFYGLLNWQAVPWAHEVMSSMPEVPFVWHFKEGPFICVDRGTFPQLAELYTRSAGQIYCSPEMRDWVRTALPACRDARHSLVLDGDLPKREWFEGAAVPRLGESDGEFHTVVPGRPIGLHPHVVAELAAQRIHLHFYGEFTHGQWREWIEETSRLAPGHLHLHPNVDQRGWVEEFSRYDAGWLHFFESRNGGDLRRADWDDLNYPARIGALLAAGLPLLQRANAGGAVATQSLVRALGIGLFFSTASDLAQQLGDARRMAEVRAAVARHRESFTFDAHAAELIAFFREAIASHHA